MNDQEKARARRYARAALSDILSENLATGSRLTAPERALDAVLSADPRVIAEAMGGEVRVERVVREERWMPGVTVTYNGERWERTTIVLPPRKVESP